MQNSYGGVVGDFGKYGLLRYLVGVRSSTSVADSLRLSVIWYLHPDESHNFDGKHITYLRRTARNLQVFRQCDPDLYDVLEALIAANQRRISRIRNSGILPTDTNYYEESLSFPAETRHPAREEARDRWLHGALEVARPVDLVFVDPDNGIANSASPYARNGPKDVFQEDLRQFGRARSVAGRLSSLGETGRGRRTDKNLVGTTAGLSRSWEFTMGVEIPQVGALGCTS